MKEVDKTRIRNLLEQYFEGGTTSEQERELRAYFANNNDVPAEEEYARAMFGYFEQAAGEKGGAWKRPQTIFSLSRARKIAIAVSAAAIVAAVVTTSLVKVAIPQQMVYCYVDGKPVTNYETARGYAQKALGLISESVQKPLEYITPGREVSSALKKLELLSIIGINI